MGKILRTNGGRNMLSIPNKDFGTRFNLQNMTEDGCIPEINMVENAAPRKANANDIVNVVLKEISKTSKYSQDMKISFMMKSGWKGYIKLWLYPEVNLNPPSVHQNNFSEIYLVENDPSFLNWKSIYYNDTNYNEYHPTYNIYLDTKDMWDSYCNHYSGIWSISWVEFLIKQKI